MSKIDFKKVGSWFADMAKANSTRIFGGVATLGLALLCRKFEMPYQILTDPFYEIPAKHTTEPMSNFIVLSNDPIETSMWAIYNSTVDMSFDWQKVVAAKEIVSILSKNKKDISKSTVTYTIQILQAISNNMSFTSYKSEITKLISEIAKGEY